MPLTNLTPNMMVENVDETVDFYRDVLGFHLVMNAPEQNPYAWALVKRDDVEMMFQARTSLTEEYPLFEGRPIGGALTFYIDMKDIETLYEKIHAQVHVVQDLQTTFYGKREFAIKDCNGFILTFAE